MSKNTHMKTAIPNIHAPCSITVKNMGTTGVDQLMQLTNSGDWCSSNSLETWILTDMLEQREPQGVLL